MNANEKHASQRKLLKAFLQTGAILWMFNSVSEPPHGVEIVWRAFAATVCFVLLWGAQEV